MSKTNRQFRGKPYRQGHEPAILDLERIRTEKKQLLYAHAYGKELTPEEQEEVDELLSAKREAT